MLVSEIVMCICLFILASFFMVKNRYPQIVDEMRWLPLISMSIYTLGFSLGAGLFYFIVQLVGFIIFSIIFFILSIRSSTLVLYG